MSIQTFEDGTVLYTGKDMEDALLASLNRRDNYDHKSCSFCEHQDKETGECDECSVLNKDRYGCSCHINPPCSFCENNHFEPSRFLINYKHYGNSGKWKWECFKSDESVFNKLTLIEKAGYDLTAEILTTGESAMYIGRPLDWNDTEIKICDRKDFKPTMCKMILDFQINISQ